jgi:hypothetical protein
VARRAGVAPVVKALVGDLSAEGARTDRTDDVSGMSGEKGRPVAALFN